jgi:hypothetical protein
MFIRGFSYTSLLKGKEAKVITHLKNIKLENIKRLYFKKQHSTGLGYLCGQAPHIRGPAFRGVRLFFATRGRRTTTVLQSKLQKASQLLRHYFASWKTKMTLITLIFYKFMCA